jgi:guanine deaminase
MKNLPLHFYIATLLNPKSDQECDFIPRGVLLVKGYPGQAKIASILTEDQALKKFAGQMNSKNTTDFGNSIIIPSFFDMHFHWVQDDVRTMPKDSLLQWLEKYTFPTEAKYAKANYSKKKAKGFFSKLVKSGTLGGAIYSSIHENAIHSAMKEVKGDFVIGNVLMNMNSPIALTQSESESLQLTRKLIKRYGTRHAFTPRFAITTTPKVMKEGARLADQSKCFKQTHLSETNAEIDFVLSLYRNMPGYEKVKTYTDIYALSGMLGPRSLMGHGIHLSGKELDTLSKTKTAIVHCPTSNAPIEEKGLGSGLFDFKKVERKKIRWALGSDIGGGPFLSMFDVMRSFVDQNRCAQVKGATYVKALYRATLAGAQILGKGRTNGSLDPKKDANFIVVPIKKNAQLISAESVLAQLIEPLSRKRDSYDRLVSQVYFHGKKI